MHYKNKYGSFRTSGNAIVHQEGKSMPQQQYHVSLVAKVKVTTTMTIAAENEQQAKMIAKALAPTSAVAWQYDPNQHVVDVEVL